MKRLFQALAAIWFVANLTTGCQTAGNATLPAIPPEHLVILSAAVQLGAHGATVYAVTQYPETRPVFVAWLPIIRAQLNSGQFDPVALKSELNQIALPANEASAAAIKNAIRPYETTFANILAQRLSTSQLAPLLKALVVGIQEGLNDTEGPIPPRP